MAFDSAPPEAAEMESEEMPEMEAPESEASEGESLSLDVFGGTAPAVGDMVTLKVTAIDPDSGMVSVMLPKAKKPGGIEAKAAMMDEEDQASITA